MQRLRCLDGLRGLLAVYVLLSHMMPFVALPERLGWIAGLFSHGMAGVDMFFILSGLVIMQSLRSFDYRPAPFLIARAARIFPAFLVVFAFAMGVETLETRFDQMPWIAPNSVAREIWSAGWPKDWWAHVLAHLTMTHGLIPDGSLPFAWVSFLGAAWSLSAEWQFYALMTVLALHFGRGAGGEIRLAAIFLAIAGVGAVWHATAPPELRFSRAFLPNKAHYFALGIASAGLVREQTRGRLLGYGAVLATCQSWLLTTSITTDESLFSQKLWMALDRTRYMQSSKTFVMVDRPFWNERDAKTNRYRMSTTLSDRITRGTYLFDNGPDKPGVICLSYSWMSDALKVLPLTPDQRVNLMLSALQNIYPDLDIRKHIVADPITVSWENDPGFLGAFKGALPGHYRYNRRMFCHFMQEGLAPAERGMFLAGDDISWTPAWAEGAVHTALNAVWGIMHHFGGATHPENPGPGDHFDRLAPIALPD